MKNVLFLSFVFFNGINAFALPIAFDSVVRQNCLDQISDEFISGTFIDPKTAELKKLVVGKIKNKTVGVILNTVQSQCEKYCDIEKFERFLNTNKPAQLNMRCGTGVNAKIKWTYVTPSRTNTDFIWVDDLRGIDTAKLRIDLNKYITE